MLLHPVVTGGFSCHLLCLDQDIGVGPSEQSTWTRRGALFVGERGHLSTGLHQWGREGLRVGLHCRPINSVHSGEIH